MLVSGCTDDVDDDDTLLFESAYEESLIEPKDDGSDCSGVRVPDRPGFGKRVALTFDDGPNPATTPQVLEILRRHDAPATFFTNGSRYSVPGAKAVAAEIAGDPLFILANHSQRHIDLARQSIAVITTEIARTDALVRAAGETPRYFRFPFGSATCASKQAAQARGYLVTGWHVDSADWCYAAGNGVCKPQTFRYVPDNMRSDMRAYVLQQVRANSGGIVLFHDVHAPTANALDAILTALEDEGYTFTRLDDATVFPKLHGMAPPPVTTQFIGDACETDATCGFQAGGQRGRCHAAKFCTVSCAGTCPDAIGKAPTFCIADGAGGICASKPAPQNESCGLLPLTAAQTLPRFLGSSSAAAATADVCAPR